MLERPQSLQTSRSLLGLDNQQAPSGQPQRLYVKGYGGNCEQRKKKKINEY